MIQKATTSICLLQAKSFRDKTEKTPTLQVYRASDKNAFHQSPEYHWAKSVWQVVPETMVFDKTEDQKFFGISLKNQEILQKKV